MIQGTPVQPARLESRASSVTAPSIQPLSQVYVGPDLNQNGIPDALEATVPSGAGASRMSSFEGTRISSDGVLAPVSMAAPSVGAPATVATMQSRGTSFTPVFSPASSPSAAQPRIVRNNAPVTASQPIVPGMGSGSLTLSSQVPRLIGSGEIS